MDTSSTLLVRVRNTGDDESWREFVAIYEPLIVAYARKHVSEHVARDVASDVFIHLLRELPKFEFDRARGRFRTWLWKLTYSATMENLRRSARRQSRENAYCVQRVRTELDRAEFDREFQRRVLDHALKKLEPTEKPRTWACFEQHIRRRRPAAEVAAELGFKTANNVYVNASRVLEKLRAICEESMGDLGHEPLDDLPG
jgi:RNA polymerase sigma-70 factor (ECF subfamily)